MYIPKQFQQTEVSELYSVINEYPLAAVIYTDADGLQANHFPLIHSLSDTGYGTLSAHVPRINPVSKIGSEALDVLVIFQGPQCYISPSWYPSKQVTEKVVPTWNYLVVHAKGKMRIIDDQNWVSAHLQMFTDKMEAKFENPWRVSDAPVDFTAKLMMHLVGVEVTIDSLEGKWKVSQNRSADDQKGVSDALQSLGDSVSLAMSKAIADS